MGHTPQSVLNSLSTRYRLYLVSLFFSTCFNQKSFGHGLTCSVSLSLSRTRLEKLSSDHRFSTWSDLLPISLLCLSIVRSAQDLVFCPHNYILDPSVSQCRSHHRERWSLKDRVIIIDAAELSRRDRRERD